MELTVRPGSHAFQGITTSDEFLTILLDHKNKLEKENPIKIGKK